MLSDLFSTDPDWTQTIIRLVLGVVFFAHGAQKVLGWFGGPGLKSTIDMMHVHLGLPVPIAFLAVSVEFLGGLGLIFGLLSRVAAAGIAFVMFARDFYGARTQWIVSRLVWRPQSARLRVSSPAIALAAVIIVRGSGAASLDRLIFN